MYREGGYAASSISLDTLSVNAPAARSLVLFASVNIEGEAGFGSGRPFADLADVYYKLLDTTGSSGVELVEVAKTVYVETTPGAGVGVSEVLTLTWVVPVTAGPHSFLTSLYATDHSIRYYTSTLQALYVPNGM